MAEPVPDLERVLALAGQLVANPELPDLSGVVGRRLREERRVRLLPPSRPLRPVLRPGRVVVLAAALATVLVAGAATLVFSPAARRATADWLGLGGVRIEIVPTLPSSPSPRGSLAAGLDLGRPVTLAEARAAVPYRVLVPGAPGLGSPDEVYLRDRPFPHQVSLVYRARPGMVAAAPTGAALLLTEFPARTDPALLKKVAAEGSTLQFLEIEGQPAVWIGGPPHELLYLDRRGRVVPDSVRLSGNVLLWERDGLTLRLEGMLTLDRALAIARSVG